jgi:hypothetical protein
LLVAPSVPTDPIWNLRNAEPALCASSASKKRLPADMSTSPESPAGSLVTSMSNSTRVVLLDMVPFLSRLRATVTAAPTQRGGAAFRCK